MILISCVERDLLRIDAIVARRPLRLLAHDASTALMPWAWTVQGIGRSRAGIRLRPRRRPVGAGPGAAAGKYQQCRARNANDDTHPPSPRECGIKCPLAGGLSSIATTTPPAT